MARRRRGGLTGILVILAGAWIIGLFAGSNDAPKHLDTKPLTTTIATSGDSAAEGDPATRSDPAQPSLEAQDPVPGIEPEPRWVRGSKIAFRTGPATTFAVLDRFNTARKVVLLTEDGEWSRVRDDLTLREGWVASRFLTDREPPARKPKIEKRDPVQQPVVVPRVEVSDAVIVDRIIAQSIASYSGNCPCPFNTDRAGRRCGKRSAYSRPGGASPICFAGDVTPDMIAAFRRR